VGQNYSGLLVFGFQIIQFEVSFNLDPVETADKFFTVGQPVKRVREILFLDCGLTFPDHFFYPVDVCHITTGLQVTGPFIFVSYIHVNLQNNKAGATGL
jgi:hypothetical protein